MQNIRSVMVLLFALSLLISAGCSTPQPPSPESLKPSPVPVAEVMSVEQAREIAEQSSCVDEGPLIGEGFYNENSGTWWFDLDIEKEGCNPACVVNAVDKTTQINWRCTGALPPKEDGDEAMDGEPALIPDPEIARDAALVYLKALDLEIYPPLGADWIQADITGDGLVGSSTQEYRYQNWVVTVQYPIVNPVETIYQIDVSETVVGFSWRGEVDVYGAVISAEMPVVAQMIACWGGFIKGLPDGAQFDDYLSLDEDKGVGIDAIDPTVAVQIQVVKDTETFVHIWGKLHCPAVDYGGCYVEVTRLREDKPGSFFEPDAVSGWIGTIKGFADGSQHDDAFILAGDFPVAFGIEGTDETVTAELAGLRDTGQVIKVWGEVSCGVPSPNGALITVSEITVQ